MVKTELVSGCLTEKALSCYNRHRLCLLLACTVIWILGGSNLPPGQPMDILRLALTISGIVL